jgi:hypothetical protein
MLCIDIQSEIRDDSEGGFPLVKHGKICFVDLAGTEKVKDTKVTGDSLSEANNINKSLLCLGNCIQALGNPKKAGSHLPFRESKLTKLLADSLGGEGYTLMIACVSPAFGNIQDTVYTLRYANRARNIKNKPVVKMDPREQLINRLKHEVKFLKAENAYFREQLGVPSSESQVVFTPTQIVDQLTPQASGNGSPIFGSVTLSSLHSSRNNSSKELSPTKALSKDNLLSNRAASAMKALGAKTGLYDMLQEYMIENENLKTENMELHRTRANAHRDQEQLFRENERLSQKLDDLGRVMLATPTSRDNVKTWLDKSAEVDARLFSGKLTLSRPGTKLLQEDGECSTSNIPTC